MRKGNREHLRRLTKVLEPILEEHDCRIEQYRRGKGHPRLTIAHSSGRSRYAVLALTPSDKRSQKNFVASVKKICRCLENGVDTRPGRGDSLP
jgi:hypothetical protein